MKAIRLLTGLSALLLAVLAQAADHSLMLTVKRVAAKGDLEHKKEIAPARQWRDAGNPDRRWVGRPVEIDFIYASETIEITVKNGSSTNETADLEYLFFKQDQGDRTERLSRRERVPLTLAGGQSQTLTFTSPVLKYSTDTVKVDGKSVRLGEKPYGYVVVLRDSAGVFKSAASAEYLRVIQDAKKLELLLDNNPAVPEPGRMP